MTREELLAEAKRISEIRCSDGYCKFGGRATGMHTNGGCRCQADPDWTRRHPYNDYQYMATLLGLIALEFQEENHEGFGSGSDEH